MVLLVGAHNTCARGPAFDWLRDATVGTRNNYDKLGHFVQGFVPAISAREIFLRSSPLRDRGVGHPSRWLGFVVVSVCLAFSAFHELIKWGEGRDRGAGAESFLGTQGHAWGTQSDMAFALVGAVGALVLLHGMHAAIYRKCWPHTKGAG